MQLVYIAVLAIFMSGFFAGNIRAVPDKESLEALKTQVRAEIEDNINKTEKRIRDLRIKIAEEKDDAKRANTLYNGFISIIEATEAGDKKTIDKTLKSGNYHFSVTASESLKEEYKNLDEISILNYPVITKNHEMFKFIFEKYKDTSKDWLDEFINLYTFCASNKEIRDEKILDDIFAEIERETQNETEYDDESARATFFLTLIKLGDNDKAFNLYKPGMHINYFRRPLNIPISANSLQLLKRLIKEGYKFNAEDADYIIWYLKNNEITNIDRITITDLLINNLPKKEYSKLIGKIVNWDWDDSREHYEEKYNGEILPLNEKLEGFLINIWEEAKKQK